MFFALWFSDSLLHGLPFLVLIRNGVTDHIYTFFINMSWVYCKTHSFLYFEAYWSATTPWQTFRCVEIFVLQLCKLTFVKFHLIFNFQSLISHQPQTKLRNISPRVKMSQTAIRRNHPCIRRFCHAGLSISLVAITLMQIFVKKVWYCRQSHYTTF